MQINGTAVDALSAESSQQRDAATHLKKESPVTPFPGGAVGVAVPSLNAPLLLPISRTAIHTGYSSTWIKCQIPLTHSRFLPLPILLIFILSSLCRKDGEKALVEETGNWYNGMEVRSYLGKGDDGIWDGKTKRREKEKKRNLFSFSLSDLSFNSSLTQPS